MWFRCFYCCIGQGLAEGSCVVRDSTSSKNPRMVLAMDYVAYISPLYMEWSSVSLTLQDGEDPGGITSAFK